MDDLRIDSARLERSIADLAAIGAYRDEVAELTGVNRLALTDLDRDSRDLFTRWCETAGCTVTYDAIGNMFARRSGRDESLPPVMTGSHLDSQPTGGKFAANNLGINILRFSDESDLIAACPASCNI